MKTFGSVTTEMKVHAPARKAWELYGTVDLTKITVPKYLAAVDIVEGEPYYEKFTKVDNKNMVKETEITQGAFFDLGFTLYRIRFENISTGKHTCITRTTIEWDIKEEFVANSSRVSILPSINIAKDIEAYLVANEKKEKKDHNSH
ncbi:hypothetical protein RJ639_023903 [Escallonia herrerae]|uniref:Bet v I/Major latex protein domain-containing protein n=1 Tax=Escallonia herrerae TaxID=1293975 RepID=A0AA88V0J2_9ASTE|nr:hypothetical protein RJ639_023903 [Escallonia herrerae]